MCFSLSQLSSLNKIQISLSLSQVWYLSGWVCYLHMERTREEREENKGGERRAGGV
jgi:hypothetical protein